MIIQLNRTHAVVFALLLAAQTMGLWITLSRSPIPRSIFAYLFFMAPGSAFLSSIVVVELIRVVLHKNH